MKKSDRQPDAAMRALLNVLQDVQSEQPQASLRQPERSVDDVAWNAVVSGRGNRFEDMPEAFSMAGLVADKLHHFKVLPADAMAHAPAVLAGLLYFLWRSQNVATLPPEMAEGWAGTVKVAAAELARRWAPPTRQPWFSGLADFPRAVDAALKRLDACSWEDVYKHLDPEMGKLASLAKETLANIRTQHPQALPAVHAWMMGTIIQKNVFSPLDGSVPEDIGQRLTKIYEGLESQAEGAFMPWLGEGFRAVRERPADELDRWRAGIAPNPQAGKASKGGGKSAGPKSKGARKR